MKSKMKIQRQTELPRFAVGALAIAGASAASGATVQISFTNNYVSSSTDLTSLVSDLTGDGVPDVVGWVNAGMWSRGVGLRMGDVGVNEIGRAYGFNQESNVARVVGGVGAVGAGVTVNLVQISFQDHRINGGSYSQFWIDLTATAAVGEYKVQINRLIFDDASTTAPTGLTSASTGIQEWSAVPEPSSLGLLALGAGGLLTRRRRAMAA